MIVAALTPMDAGLNIHAEILARHCVNMLDGGASRVALFGTTGEAPSFGVAERRDALDRIIAHGAPANQLMVGTSAAALTDVIDLSLHALDAGCDGVFFMPPFFFRGPDAAGAMDAMAWILARGLAMFRAGSACTIFPIWRAPLLILTGWPNFWPRFPMPLAA
ncbi:MAG: dihydrodipicolinate synthase family protein [Alphaproteobacteria bacterium]|nr:dihydrodipicolinate synthase family protein [Alphaproteobacteria bacterium]